MSDNYLSVAKKMKLFILNQDLAGCYYWLPNGKKLYNNLSNFIRNEHEDKGYEEVKSPNLSPNHLFDKSGHNEKYDDLIFKIKDSDYALRPMSCPNHIFMYQSELRSYKDLPVKYFEFGDVYRNESSGSLKILFRGRNFVQDDSHLFVRRNQVIDVVSDYLKMSINAYKKLGFNNIKFFLSLRPEKRFGSEMLWDESENNLKNALLANDIDFELQEGEGAFYGPKIELQVSDNNGKYWQLGVIQLDYVLPERFDLSYINENGEKERPVILHHAVLGSLERMIGILLESYKEKLPDFLHPYPFAIIPLSNQYLDEAFKIKKYIKNVKNSDSNIIIEDRPLKAKIKDACDLGYKYIIVVGEKEKQIIELNQIEDIINKCKKV